MHKFFIILAILLTVICRSAVNGQDMERPGVIEGIYYKNDIGFSWNTLNDQRMSNLHYKGPGGVLNFSRYVQKPGVITELSFARLRYNNIRPGHKNTVVETPGAGIRYMYLRKLAKPESANMYAGAQINVFGNVRMAPRLGNSYLYADMIAEIRPQAELYLNRHFLWRNWNIEASLAASLAGYTLRIPEYGVSFELSEDAVVKYQGYESKILTPLNYMHLTSGIFARESFWGEDNPNWFRIGYVWDYYTMKGEHSLNLNNALHQIVIELYFRVR